MDIFERRNLADTLLDETQSQINRLKRVIQNFPNIHAGYRATTSSDEIIDRFEALKECGIKPRVSAMVDAIIRAADTGDERNLDWFLNFGRAFNTVGDALVSNSAQLRDEKIYEFFEKKIIPVRNVVQAIENYDIRRRRMPSTFQEISPYLRRVQQLVAGSVRPSVAPKLALSEYLTTLLLSGHISETDAVEMLSARSECIHRRKPMAV